MKTQIFLAAYLTIVSSLPLSLDITSSTIAPRPTIENRPGFPKASASENTQEEFDLFSGIFGESSSSTSSQNIKTENDPIGQLTSEQTSQLITKPKREMKPEVSKEESNKEGFDVFQSEIVQDHPKNHIKDEGGDDHETVDKPKGSLSDTSKGTQELKVVTKDDMPKPDGNINQGFDLGLGDEPNLGLLKDPNFGSILDLNPAASTDEKKEKIEPSSGDVKNIQDNDQKFDDFHGIYPDYPDFHTDDYLGLLDFYPDYYPDHPDFYVDDHPDFHPDSHPDYYLEHHPDDHPDFHPDHHPEHHPDDH